MFRETALLSRLQASLLVLLLSACSSFSAPRDLKKDIHPFVEEIPTDVFESVEVTPKVVVENPSCHILQVAQTHYVGPLSYFRQLQRLRQPGQEPVLSLDTRRFIYAQHRQTLEVVLDSQHKIRTLLGLLVEKHGVNEVYLEGVTEGDVEYLHSRAKNLEALLKSWGNTIKALDKGWATIEKIGEPDPENPDHQALLKATYETHDSLEGLEEQLFADGAILELLHDGISVEICAAENPKLNDAVWETIADDKSPEYLEAQRARAEAALEFILANEQEGDGFAVIVWGGDDARFFEAVVRTWNKTHPEEQVAYSLAVLKE